MGKQVEEKLRARRNTQDRGSSNKYSPSLSPTPPPRRHLTSWSAGLQLSRGALRPALYSPQDYKTMHLRISLSLSRTLSLSLSLPPLSSSYSPGRRHLTSGSASLQLSRVALQPALIGTKTTQLCVCASLPLSLSHSLPPSLPPSLLLPWPEASYLPECRAPTELRSSAACFIYIILIT